MMLVGAVVAEVVAVLDIIAVLDAIAVLVVGVG